MTRPSLSLRGLFSVLGIVVLAYVIVVTVQLGAVVRPAAELLRGRTADLLGDHDAIAASMRRMRDARREVARHVPPFRGDTGGRVPTARLSEEVRALLDQGASRRASVERADLPLPMRQHLSAAIEEETATGIFIIEAIRAVELGRAGEAVEALRASGIRSDSSEFLLSRAQREAMDHLLQSEGALERQLVVVQRWALIWLGVGLALFAAGAWLVRVRLLRPVRDLEAGVRRVAAGDLVTAVPVTVRDELGRLAEYVNDMRAVLRERAEVERRRRENLTERFGRLLDASSNAILVFDAESRRAVQANRGALDALGYAPEEVGAITLPTLLAGLAPAALEEQLVRLRGGAAPRLFLSTQLARRDGGRFPVELSLQHMRDQDAELFVMVAEDAGVRQRVRELDRELADVRLAVERALAEQEGTAALTTVLRRAASALQARWCGVWRGEGRDEAALVVFDAKEGRLLDTALLRDLPAPAGVEALAERIALAGPGEARLVVARGVGGAAWTAEERAFTAALAALLGRTLDALDRRGLEQALARAQRLDSIGQLAGGIAHDFNNILTAILGNLEVARHGLSPGEPLDASLAEAEQSARRAADLTRQLLTFARHQPVEMRPTDVNAAARESERMLRRLLPTSVTLELALAPDLPAVRAGAGQLEQVLLNLVLNARDAMPRGGTVRVASRPLLVEGRGAGLPRTLPPGRYVELSIADTGAGIPPEVLERIFEPFFTTKEPGKGTGLGLAVCYGIVQQLGGEIEVSSVAGAGSTFRVWLPAAASVEGAAAPVGAAAATPAERPAGVRGGTILVVEDERAIRDLAARALARQGFSVLTAADGEEALAVAAAHARPVDAVVSDVVMPKLSGPDTVRALRRARPGLPALFMSGYTADALRDLQDLAGAEFLAKPFTTDELCRRVQAMLDRHSPATGTALTDVPRPAKDG